MECPNCGRHISSNTRQCITCGKAVPPAQHLLEQSGVVPPSAPSSVPSVSPAVIDVPDSPCHAAHLGDRLIAAALDRLIILCACAVVSVWSFMHWGVASSGEFHLTTASLLIAATLSAASAFAYLWLFEAAFETTLGKAMVGLRVVRTTSRGALAACAIRNALRLIDGLGFYLVGLLFAEFSRLRQRLGDIIGGTVVVEEKLPAGVKALAALVWTAALLVSVWTLPRLSAGPLPGDPPRYLGASVVQIGYSPGSAYVRLERWRVDLQFPSDASTNNQVTAATH